ncbi:MAG: cupin domain-containing protein [Synergistaceae bacterium]|jgi:cupin 2 domain-containing protein|nr:cupin domain-containing protein [Synergistaceae bacterium]
MENRGNLFENREAGKDSESVQVLLELPGVRIERIASFGQESPPGFWYEQEEGEWVALLEGEACLEWENGRRLRMQPGDWVFLPARERHRVAWTAPGRATLWLAVFCRSPN